MTGTGTQTDPYIIMTAEDLYAMDEIGGTDVCFKLGADIDLNGTPYAEHFSAIPLKCEELDGGGHCIRNIISKSIRPYSQTAETYPHIFLVTPRSGGATITIKNLRIENTYLSGDFVSVFFSGTEKNKGANINMYNCVFLLNVMRCGPSMPSIEKRSCMRHESISSLKMELCTVCIEGELTIPFSFCSGMTITRCHIHLDVDIDTCLTRLYNMSAMISQSAVSDSYVTGSVRYGDIANASSSYKLVSDEYCTFDNSYFALNVVDAERLYWDGKFITACFYNSDLVLNTIRLSNSSQANTKRLYALTTDQCKDAEYLASLGFLCVGDEEE